mmetsp:Transcript_138192/g.257869  ORF Transcript_138192/g.257869 Transcript_138192/m.257869 type:complete len:284 (+) Transcript_138192:47-898(+)
MDNQVLCCRWCHNYRVIGVYDKEFCPVTKTISYWKRGDRAVVIRARHIFGNSYAWAIWIDNSPAFRSGLHEGGVGELSLDFSLDLCSPQNRGPVFIWVERGQEYVEVVLTIHAQLNERQLLEITATRLSGSVVAHMLDLNNDSLLGVVREKLSKEVPVGVKFVSSEGEIIDVAKDRKKLIDIFGLASTSKDNRGAAAYHQSTLEEDIVKRGQLQRSHPVIHKFRPMAASTVAVGRKAQNGDELSPNPERNDSCIMKALSAALSAALHWARWPTLAVQSCLHRQ